MTRARFVQEAEAEFLHEVKYYAEVQPSGAALFRGAVEAATVRALNFPKAGLPYLVRTRRVFVRGYRFFLVPQLRSALFARCQTRLRTARLAANLRHAWSSP